ncbi:MAG: STAS domain-containing protein, partial [Terrimicrobiaceae bacterium]|nr:STAS domain-containing protein [Terrimicrobiaceae bacterium]
MENVLVGTLGDTAWVRVEGRGSFKNSGGLKDFFGRMLERGFRRFAVDLANCELMDSTFMGTLAGLALRLRETGGGGLRVLNTSPRNRD